MHAWNRAPPLSIGPKTRSAGSKSGSKSKPVTVRNTLAQRCSAGRPMALWPRASRPSCKSRRLASARAKAGRARSLWRRGECSWVPLSQVQHDWERNCRSGFCGNGARRQKKLSVPTSQGAWHCHCWHRPPRPPSNDCTRPARSCPSQATVAPPLRAAAPRRRLARRWRLPSPQHGGSTS